MVRGTIDSVQRTSGSTRARQGKLFVVERKCPYCNHKKGFDTLNIQKCCKCKRKYKW